jgi:hypothetical protein
MSTSFTVNNETDLNNAIQQIDLTGSSSAPNTSYTITFGSGLAGANALQLPPISTPSISPAATR